MKANELTLAEAFRKEAVSGFEKYLPRIVDCLELLSEEEIWWRPNEASNSAGNLVLRSSPGWAGSPTHASATKNLPSVARFPAGCLSGD